MLSFGLPMQRSRLNGSEAFPILHKWLGSLEVMEFLSSLPPLSNLGTTLNNKKPSDELWIRGPGGGNKGFIFLTKD